MNRYAQEAAGVAQHWPQRQIISCFPATVGGHFCYVSHLSCGHDVCHTHPNQRRQQQRRCPTCSLEDVKKT